MADAHAGAVLVGGDVAEIVGVVLDLPVAAVCARVSRGAGEVRRAATRRSRGRRERGPDGPPP